MAQGFMSGFGPAFAQSYMKTRDDISTREDDLFKIKYNDFLRTKDERMKTQKEESQAKNQAMQIAKDLNDPNAAPFIYKQIMDFGINNVQRKVEDGRLTFDEGYKPQDVPEEATVQREMEKLQEAPGISRAGINRINSRLDKATGGRYESITAPSNSPYSGIDTGAYSWTQPSTASEKVGTLQDAIWNRNKALQEKNPAEARVYQLKVDAIQEAEALKAAIEANASEAAAVTTMSNTWIDDATGKVVTGVMARKGGQPVFLQGPSKIARPAEGLRQMSVAELKARSDVRTIAGGQVEEYNKSVNAALSALNVSGQLMTIVEQDDSVLAGGAGTFATAVATGVKELDAFSSLVEQLRQESVASGQTEQTDKMVKEAEGQLKDILNSGVVTTLQDKAARKKVFDNLRVLLAYRQAESLENGGRFSDQDIQRHLETITTPTNKEAFIDGLRSLMKESVGRVDGLEASIESNSELSVARSNFQEQFGYDMYDGEDIKSIEYFIDSMDGPRKVFVDRAWSEVQNPTLFTTTTPPMTERQSIAPEAPTAPDEDMAAAARKILEERRKKRGEEEALQKKMESMPGAAGRKARRDSRGN